MKPYLIASGVVYGLVVAIHLVRLAVEGGHVLTDPFFVISTLVSGGLCLWAVRLLRPEHRK